MVCSRRAPSSPSVRRDRSPLRARVRVDRLQAAGSIDPDEEAAREVVDANEACVLIGNGEHGAWVEGTYTSRRWLEHQGTALRGDSRSACEVAKMLKKVHKQTRTCTTREVEDFAHDACGR